MSPDIALTLQKWGTLLAIGVALFLTGFVKGCQHEQADYKEAETKFIERVKVVTKIEKVEVPVFRDRIQWLKETETRLIEAAKNETINAPVAPVCDLSPWRVQRITEAATGHP